VSKELHANILSVLPGLENVIVFFSGNGSLTRRVVTLVSRPITKRVGVSAYRRVGVTRVRRESPVGRPFRAIFFGSLTQG
jgi:hypothetical protein